MEVHEMVVCRLPRDEIRLDLRHLATAPFVYFSEQITPEHRDHE